MEPNFRTTSFKAPSGFSYTIREQNGEDEDILSNPRDAKDLTNLVKFISSLVMVVVFSFYSERGKKFWNTGCAVLSLILAFIFFDSAMFNTGENGSASSIFIQSISPDVKCERGMVIFKYKKGDESEWRCPTSIAMMQESGKMFIPWPDYEDGKSKDLTKGIDKLQDEFKDK